MHVVTTKHVAKDGGWVHPLPADMDSASTLVIAFGSSKYAEDAPAFQDLRTAFPTAHIVGCSTAGEISGTSIEDETLTVAIARFDHTKLRSAFEPIGPESSFAAGVRIARALAKDDLRGVFVVSSADGVNGSQLALGMQDVLRDVPISGALAADGTRFERTWIVAGGHRREGFVGAVGFYGDAVTLGHGSKGGWDKFGPERRITRSKGNVLYELDGRPALELYKSYLGELAAGLPATALLYPLTIRTDRSAPDAFVRTVLSHSDAEQSLTFAGDMPQGSLAQLMRANFDRLVLAAADAAESSLAAVARAELCVAVSCVGRRLVLGERAEEETEAVADVVPSNCPIIGFYSYGELSPLSTGGCRLHNQTMTLTTFTERTGTG
jgi:hypothetical protein